MQKTLKSELMKYLDSLTATDPPKTVYINIKEANFSQGFIQIYKAHLMELYGIS